MGPAVLRRNAWISAVAIGIVFVVAGIYMMAEGFNAKDTVKDYLKAEQITTSSDAAIPNALVASVSTAEAQEQIIKEHTLGTYGPYSGMERSDPNRETYLKGVTLRNALNLAILGFKVSDLVAGLGAIVVLLGVTNIVIVGPMMFMLGRPPTAVPATASTTTG